MMRKNNRYKKLLYINHNIYLDSERERERESERERERERERQTEREREGPFVKLGSSKCIIKTIYLSLDDKLHHTHCKT